MSEQYTFMKQALPLFDENHSSLCQDELRLAIHSCHSTLYQLHGEEFPEDGTLRECLETCVESTRALSGLPQCASLPAHLIEELYARWAAILTSLYDS
jgi:hypothetical protein